jgi:hypothetical protein
LPALHERGDWADIVQARPMAGHAARVGAVGGADDAAVHLLSEHGGDLLPATIHLGVRLTMLLATLISARPAPFRLRLRAMPAVVNCASMSRQLLATTLAVRPARRLHCCGPRQRRPDQREEDGS